MESSVLAEGGVFSSMESSDMKWSWTDMTHGWHACTLV